MLWLFQQTLFKYDIHPDDFVVGIHPGANFPSLRISQEKWASFADLITEKYGKKAVLLGGSGDHKLINTIKIKSNKNITIIHNLQNMGGHNRFNRTLQYTGMQQFRSFAYCISSWNPHPFMDGPDCSIQMVSDW